MIIKSRTAPTELKPLKSIRARKMVSQKVENQVNTLEKGYFGETLFDQRLESLSLDRLIINDLLLETNNTHYQIDSLLISQNIIHIFEIKNYEGDYVINGECWKSVSSGKEVKNPLLQLMRSESLFRRLLQQLGSNLTIKGHLVFINPEFYLYQASPDLPIIFPSQLDRFISSLNVQSSKIGSTHHTLAKKLLSLHIMKSPFSVVPEYRFDELEKGILCGDCYRGFMGIENQYKLICHKCGNAEDIGMAVIRSIKELNLLFPEIKITTKTVFDWCKIIKDKRTIRKILENNYRFIPLGKYSYYEFRK